MTRISKQIHAHLDRNTQWVVIDNPSSPPTEGLQEGDKVLVRGGGSLLPHHDSLDVGVPITEAMVKKAGGSLHLSSIDGTRTVLGPGGPNGGPRLADRVEPLLARSSATGLPLKDKAVRLYDVASEVVGPLGMMLDPEVGLGLGDCRKPENRLMLDPVYQAHHQANTLMPTADGDGYIVANMKRDGTFGPFL